MQYFQAITTLLCLFVQACIMYKQWRLSEKVYNDSRFENDNILVRDVLFSIVCDYDVFYDRMRKLQSAGSRDG